MLILSILTVLLIAGANISFATGAECNPEGFTYFCPRITSVFPNKVYKDYYNLECVNCRIPIFGSSTFPVLAQLISFNVSASGIENITQGAFGNLPRLKRLYLQNNKVSGISPGAFEGLTQLQELLLDNNELSFLTVEFLRGLESDSVSLANNHIKEIAPHVFKGNLGILVLNLANNKIGILHTTSFMGLENIQILYLQNNNICYLPLGIFKHISKARELNLAGNKLKSFVPGTFSGLQDLLMLNLAENDFIEFNPIMLLPFSKLSQLDISRNGLYFLDAHSLHLVVPTLRTLSIDDNLWSCSLLTNLIQYFKRVNIDVGVKSLGRYEVTNINGVACLLEDVVQKIPFEKFLEYVQYHTNQSVNYC